MCVGFVQKTADEMRIGDGSSDVCSSDLEQGAAFDNYVVTYTFCCPSRATMLRGQYAHNHRMQGNVLPTGGARKFRALGHDRSTIATWLQAAGYRTGLIGKIGRASCRERACRYG